MHYINKYNKYLIKNIQKGGLSVNDKILYEGKVATIALIENGRVYISYDSDPSKNIFEITLRNASNAEQDMNLANSLMFMKQAQPPAQPQAPPQAPQIIIQNKSVYNQNGTDNKVYVTNVTADNVTCVRIVRYVNKYDFNVDDSQTVTIPIANFNNHYSKFS
jgi:hypothetical protein